jgi:hypothetical protein
MKPVLYVSHSKRGLFYYNDASARYRCVFPAEALIAEGKQAHAIHFSQINKVTLSSYQKIVFHRPQYSVKLLRITRYLQKNNIEYWVDFDDLLFRPELSTSSAAVQSGKMSIALAKKHANNYQKALKLFTNCQVSTDALAEHIKYSSVKTTNIKVIYNRIPERWTKQLDDKSVALDLAKKTKDRLNKKIIRYLPGTSHHKHDFAHIENFLVTLLQENPSYHLNIIGDLDFHHHDFPPDQISHTAFQPYEQLPSLIDDSWIIIAPLVNNIFNQCKSALKFWESGVFGIPVISSSLQDMERFKNEGLCISDNTSEWDAFIHSMENLEFYEFASTRALETSQQAIITQPPHDHRYIYLRLTSEFGPRWPADLINPAVTTQKKLFDAYTLILIRDTNKNTEEDKAMLLLLANKSTKNDTPKSRSSVKRKIRKLINSPIDFFKDIRF